MNYNFGPREGEPRTTIVRQEFAVFVTDYPVGWAEACYQLDLASSSIRFRLQVVKHPVNPRLKHGHEDQHIEYGIGDDGEQEACRKHSGKSSEALASRLDGGSRRDDDESKEYRNEYD